MSITTLVGLGLAWGSLIASIIIDGGHLNAFAALSPAILVFGGTLGAVCIGMTMEEVKMVPSYLMLTFKGVNVDMPGTITRLCDMAMRSRRDGILSLENEIETLEDEFMKKGFQLCVDGVDTEKLAETLETEVATLKHWYKQGEEFFKQLGGFSPTLGIIGTVLGLIHMLASLENAESMGPAIAMAFIATLYGVSAANLLYLPLGNKLKALAARDLMQKQVVVHGVIGIQTGMSPRLLEQSLHTYLHEHERPTPSREGGK